MIHSYPWYFADWLGSETRVLLTPEGRGIYRDLLDKCWEQGSLPSDERVLAKLADCQLTALRRCWPVIQKHFVERDGRLYNQRVDADRPRLINWREARRNAGKRGGEARSKSQAIASSKPEAIATGLLEANVKPPSSSSSSSSSSSIDPLPLTDPIAAWVGKLCGLHPSPSDPRYPATFCSDNWHRLGGDAARFEAFMGQVFAGLQAWTQHWETDGNRFAVSLDKWLSGGGWNKPVPKTIVAKRPESRFAVPEAVKL